MKPENSTIDLRCVFPILLALALGACTGQSAKRLEPINANACVRLAGWLSSAVNSGNGQLADDYVNVTGLVFRATDGMNLSLEEQIEIAGRFNGRLHPGDDLATEVRGGGSFTPVQYHLVNGESRVLVRLIGASGTLDYCDLIFGRDSSTSRSSVEPGSEQLVDISVIDIYRYSLGETLGDGIRRLTVPGRSFFEKLFGSELDTLGVLLKKTLDSMDRASWLGRFGHVTAFYRELPEELRKDKQILKRYLSAAQFVGPESYGAAVDLWRSYYPNDPGSVLHLMRKFSWMKQYDSLLESIDRLDGILEGDAYLKFLRGSASLMKGDSAMAREWFARAIKSEPFLVQPYRPLIRLFAATGQFADAQLYLNDLATRFGIEVEDLEQELVGDASDARMTAFMRSKEYAEWKADRMEARAKFGRALPQHRISAMKRMR